MSGFKRKIQRDKEPHWKKSYRKRARAIREYKAYMESLPDDDPRKIEYMKEQNQIRHKK